MDSVAVLHTYVFLLSFASAFLLGGKRPLLALSTRVLLVVLLALAVGYAVSAAQWYHGYVGVATLIANAVFVGFVAIDVRNWQRRRSER
ncbi:MAG TPA: hypothetical protein VMA36_09075 [Candidatus Limnocylindria bacterium]|jgi:hypothetical protein|nr:hypothetical protein [Candidatus Limnocylindria bacterium]